MAVIAVDYKSDLVTDQTTNPQTTLVKPNRQGGKQRAIHFRYEPTIAVAANKVIALCRIPAGSRIMVGRICSNGAVATATLALGLAAVDGSGEIDRESSPTSDTANLFATALAIDTAGEFSFANTIALNAYYEVKKDCYLIAKLGTAGMTASTHKLHGFVSIQID